MVKLYFLYAREQCSFSDYANNAVRLNKCRTGAFRIYTRKKCWKITRKSMATYVMPLNSLAHGRFGCNFTHWGRMTHICVGYLTIIGPDNGLSSDRRQTIIWTNAGISLIRTLGTNFSEILSEIHAFSLKKMRFTMSPAKWRPFCLGLNVLKVLFPRTSQIARFIWPT